MPPSPRKTGLREVWNGKTIVDLSREFLNSNGAERTRQRPHRCPAMSGRPQSAGVSFEEKMESMVSNLNVC